ncbi:MAG: M20/M25/M40 family metallo-hydrolase [Acidobacteriaceae bacterium]|nr:M20/M25/M40 family metallo-hydrolase [Acidobacteriaceae bacterium]MBV9780665.1 M20/M25/M40 family metallo-hydrolase [Acidobacteriaceae bacterium]
MLRQLRLVARGLATVFIAVAIAASEENVDLYTMQRIRAEERSHSKVMDTLFYLSDVNGPRLTNSPNFFSAANWVVKQLSDLGIPAKTEKWGPFGRSWRVDKFYAAMVEPQYQALIGFPLAWTASTPGQITAEAIIATIYTEADMEKYKGKLKGKVVLSMKPRSLELSTKPLSSRWSDSELAETEKFPEANAGRAANRSRLPEPWQNMTPDQLRAIRKKINEFFASENVAAILSFGYAGDGGTVFGSSGGDREPKDEVPPASIVVTPEHYNRIYRLLSHEIPVKLDLDVKTTILPPQDSANVIAEIAGGKKKDEVVMLGAHLDSWHGGTGATDNGAGSAVTIEAIRLLKTLNLRMDRTVRLALWGGEEEGLLGSRAYVKEHFGDPETMKLTEAHAKLDAYFNLDNGSGKIRGIYLQGNDMCRPIFEQWFMPFKDMEAGAITVRDTGGTDHLSFDAVGLPGFQFIQDELEYSTRTHHSNMDVYDRASESDLKQAATIVASFVYLTANRSEMLPRKPLPPPKPAPKPVPEEPAKGKPAA